MLKLEAVGKSYGGRPLFHGLGLELRPGEYVALMGESGSGKSTLLNLIAGLDRPDAGRILIEGRDMAALDDDRATLLRRRSMGFVFQAFHILPHLTVAQNVALPLLLLGQSPAQARSRVVTQLQAVGLGGREDSWPRELSGGEMQRVAIARALVHRPALLLADEPTGNLDQDSATRILTLLRRQIKEDDGGTRMGLLATHSPRAAATADRILLLTPAGLVPQDTEGGAAE